MTRAFLVALQFLTRLPVRLACKPSADDLGRSACAYPWVGLLIGLIGALVYLPLQNIDSLLLAILLLTLLVLLSGGLHLDGLADTVDAWVGGHGDRETTLRIMKDTAVGAMGAISLILLLLGKFACLEILLRAQQWPALLLVPVIGRMALLALLLTTPYVRTEGLGTDIAQHIPRRTGWFSLTAAGVLVVLAAGLDGLFVLGLAALCLWMLRRKFLARIGGLTGDTLGAACEIVEIVALAALVLAQGFV